MARSASGRDAVGVGGWRQRLDAVDRPAMTVSSPRRPASSTRDSRGMSSAHCIVKYGSTILSAAGRFSQIWNSSVVFGPVRSSRGNISQWTMPAPAVSHCTSPPSEARRRAQRVRVVDEALAHEGDRLESTVRVLGESRHHAAVVHAPAVAAREVHAQIARLQGRGRPEVLVGRRIAVEVVDAEEERVGRPPLHAEGDGLQYRVSHVVEPTDLRGRLPARPQRRTRCGWMAPAGTRPRRPCW